MTPLCLLCVALSASWCLVSVCGGCPLWLSGYWVASVNFLFVGCGVTLGYGYLWGWGICFGCVFGKRKFWVNSGFLVLWCGWGLWVMRLVDFCWWCG